MNLQIVVTVHVMALTLLATVMSLIHRPAGYAAWAADNLGVCMTGALALFYAPATFGWIVSLFLVPIIAMPLVLWLLSQRMFRHDPNA
jgi:hypothetical protein